MTAFEAAQIDPFCPEALGAKIPDSNTYPSTAFKIADIQAGLQTDANGIIAFAMLPSVQAYAVKGVSASTSSWTWTAAYGGTTASARIGSITSNFTLFRPVAHGIRVSCMAAIS